MPKITVTVFFLIMSLASVRAQNFIDTSKTWNVVGCSCGGWAAYSTSTYKFMSDTIIGSYTYSNLFVSDDSTPNSWYFDSQLREDTALKKVYWRINNHDTLLYDFNLLVGDTFSTVNKNGFPCQDMIVDSIQINNFMGINRKQWFFNTYTPFGPETWVEGIGNLSGLKHNLTMCTVDAGSSLLCYKEYNILNYFNSYYNTCYYTTVDINQLANPFEDFIVFPNPTQNEFTLKTNNFQSKYIIIQNLLGETIQTFTSNQSLLTFKIANPGIYFLTISQGGKLWKKKVIQR